jgi:hypothetical protein
MQLSIDYTPLDITGDSEPEADATVEPEASVSTSAERAGYADWRRFAPVLGDGCNWYDAGKLPSGDGFACFIACAL